ncbi:MAG TPA: hypothetical protein PL009_11620 [Flavipsychrobacter sp.]|nr:hypothetical protein [Flavipsychrobacter sp.]
MQILFWALAILFSLAIGYWIYRADVRRAVPYPWLTALLRTLVVFLTCLLLIAPFLSINKNETQKPVIVFLQDNSQSVPVALKNDTAAYQKNAQQLLEKLEDDYRVVKWGFGNNIQRDTLFQYQQQATDIANALSQAVEFYGQQNLGAVILSSDGRYNQGINPQYQELAFQGYIYAVALGDSAVQKDIRIANVYANKTVTLNSQFEIRADIIAQRSNGYNNNVRLTEVNGGATGTASLNISSDRFDRAVSFTVKADRAGLHHYIISVPPADGEQNTANNRKDIFVEVVSEKKNVLLAANAPHPDINAIREALAGLEGYNVTVKTGDQLPSSFADYQVVILHSLPSQNNVVQQLASSKKAVWLIMGANSNNAAFNNLQDIAQLNVNPFNLQNQFAAYNTSFTAFTMPQNINAVMDKMPPLAVPGGMIQPNPNALVLFASKGNNNMPLWLLQQGNPPSALLMGEGIWRWRLFEYRHFNSHNVVDEAIRQTVSFLAANVNERPFHVELLKYVWSDQEAITLNAYLLNVNNEQVNTANVNIVITDSAGRKQNYSFERLGNAYKLNIGLREAGFYSYTASTNYNGKTYTANGSFVVQNMPIEMMETGANYPLLHSIAHKHNGALVPHANVLSLYDSIKNNQSIKPVIQSTTETIPLVDWKWYFFLILAVATAEWLLRKYWMAQ